MLQRPIFQVISDGLTTKIRQIEVEGAPLFS